MFTPNVFHKMRIECIGNTVKTWLDGVPVSYLVDSLTANEGIFALQVHSIGKPEYEGIKIFWKNIRVQTKNIKPLAFGQHVGEKIDFKVNFHNGFIQSQIENYTIFNKAANFAFFRAAAFL